MLDPVTKAVLDTIAASGVTIHHEQTLDGQYRITARDPATGNMHVVTVPDLYAGVCDIAQRVGFDLEDA